MSLLDKVVAAVTPPESAADRADARARARSLAQGNDWLARIVDHHEGIEAAFARVKAASDATGRAARLKELGVLLTGHAQAEEAVIYPALADSGEKGHAGTGYDEQAMVKVQMALLDKLDPLSQAFLDKLEHIEGAVAHHVYAEENNWFPDLKEKAPAGEQAALTARYGEEYDRYVGTRQPEAPARADFLVTP